MSKLTSEQGSILVATVSFTVVMAIAGSGLMMMSGNSVSHEQQAFLNDQAFLAAESGLQLGTQWLADTANWNATIGSNVPRDPIFNGNIGDIPVHVWLEIGANGPVLNSLASTPDIEFDKQVSWVVEQAPSPVVFINNMEDASSQLNNTWFDGPFHSNTPLVFPEFSDSKADAESPYFTNGPVSVHNDTDHISFPSGDYGEYGDGPSGNNYDFGIYVASGGGANPAQQLDNFFQNTFQHSQSQLYLPTISGEDILLPLNYSSAPENMALLFYHIDPNTWWGRAAYFYSDGGGIRRSFYCYINHQVLRARNDICVIGTVRGRTTLVTNTDCDIYPAGDLVYDGFIPQPDAEYDNYDNQDNYGIPADNTSILALVSGGDICFAYEKQEINTSDTSLRSASPGEYMYLTALLYAYGNNHGMVWQNGCHFDWRPDLMDHEQFNYNLRAIGGRAIDRFFNYTLSGGAEANQRFRFFADTRINDNFTAPGVPGFLSTGGNGQPVNLVTTNWRERNIPR
jgi:hypothetical protein